MSDGVQLQRVISATMMMQSTQSWEELRRHARTAERELEDNIAAYAAINKAAKRTVGEFDAGEFGGRIWSGGEELTCNVHGRESARERLGRRTARD
jgi:hypothetical protein